MRRRSSPGFVARVAALAAVELLLTALWLQLLFAGVALPG
jgi:hypothetical protein